MTWRKMRWWFLAVAWLALTLLALWVVEGRAKCQLISEIDLCYRPQDVLSTECVYDVATDTHLRFDLTETACTPLDYPDEAGVVYTRLQWTAACGRCLEDGK